MPEKKSPALVHGFRKMYYDSASSSIVVVSGPSSGSEGEAVSGGSSEEDSEGGSGGSSEETSVDSLEDGLLGSEETSVDSLEEGLLGFDEDEDGGGGTLEGGRLDSLEDSRLGSEEMTEDVREEVRLETELEFLLDADDFNLLEEELWFSLHVCGRWPFSYHPVAVFLHVVPARRPVSLQ